MRLIEKHGAALDYDLMTRTGRTLHEFWSMGAPGRVALVHFTAHLDADSALAREAGGMDVSEWASTFKTNAMLADLYDLVQYLDWHFVSANIKKGQKPKRPKEYPRPWAKDKTQHFGKGAVPISQFWDWWDGKKEA